MVYSIKIIMIKTKYLFICLFLFFQGLADECKQLGSQGLMMLTYIKEKSPMTKEQIINVKNQSKKISTMSEMLSNGKGNVEAIGELVENELSSMDKAIEEAANRMQVRNLYI